MLLVRIFVVEMLVVVVVCVFLIWKKGGMLGYIEWRRGGRERDEKREREAEGEREDLPKLVDTSTPAFFAAEARSWNTS